MRSWTFPRVPKSANRMLRAHWGVRRRDRWNWRKHVRAVCGKPPEKMRGRVRLDIVVSRRRRQDPDNAYASVKPLLDVLVREGWLEDDSPECLSLEVTECTERRSGRQRTEVGWSRVDKEDGVFEPCRGCRASKRREFVKALKERRGCKVCGEKRDARQLLLVRPAGRIGSAPLATGRHAVGE